MGKLRIYNTLSRKKEVFKPLTAGKVRMYVCGITVYDYCHLGHARCYVAFDAIFRYLKYLDYEVTYIQNITDLDDKLIKKAHEEEGGDMKDRVAQLAKKYTKAYFDDMEKLNVLKADSYPRATKNIREMQKIIGALIKKGYAYRRGGNIFFEVIKFDRYGELSRRNLEEMKAGARVRIDEQKKSPMDFALWKEASPDEPTWPSPWGEGRPGWHIECSAMSMKELGPTFDIHGGGQDLIFPHHENERAQSEAYSGKPFVRYWLHNGFVTVNQEKMSKSLGNVFNLKDIFPVYQPRVVRFFLLSQHYRSPVDYSEEALPEAKNALFRLDNCVGLARERVGDLTGIKADEEAMEAFSQAMDDDFNTAAALGVAHKLASEVNNALSGGEGDEKLKKKVSALLKICDVLGIELEPISVQKVSQPDPELTSEQKQIQLQALLQKEILSKSEVMALVAARLAFRTQKKWEMADKIRKVLGEKRIQLRDGPEYTSYIISKG